MFRAFLAFRVEGLGFRVKNLGLEFFLFWHLSLDLNS